MSCQVVCLSMAMSLNICSISLFVSVHLYHYDCFVFVTDCYAKLLIELIKNKELWKTTLCHWLDEMHHKYIAHDDADTINTNFHLENDSYCLLSFWIQHTLSNQRLNKSNTDTDLTTFTCLKSLSMSEEKIKISNWRFLPGTTSDIEQNSGGRILCR